MNTIQDTWDAINEMKSDACVFFQLGPDVLEIVIDECSDIAQLDYEGRTLYLNKDYVRSMVEDKKPTLLRSTIASYVYRYRNFKDTGAKILNPRDIHCEAYGVILALLKGTPMAANLIDYFIGKERIQSEIKKWLNLDTKFGRTQNRCYKLALSGESKSKLDNILTSAKQNTAHLDKYGINGKGTKDNPFENINEAFDALLAEEKKAISDDPYQNSPLIKSQYPLVVQTDITGNQNQYSFHVAWALPQVAHRINPFPENHFIFSGVANPYQSEMNRLKIFEASNPIPCERMSLKPNLKNRKFLFRGQNEDYKGICTPNLHRKGTIFSIQDHLMNIETQCAIANHPFSRLFGIEGVEIFNEKFRMQLNLKGLSQHYYSKTSCLDLTSDIDTAKFFAVCTTKDGDTYEVYNPKNPNEPGVIYYYEMQLPNAFQWYSPGYMLSPIGKQYIFGRSSQQHGFLLDIPRGHDFMESRFSRAIYFKHDPQISQEIFEKAKKGLKYFPKNDHLMTFWKNLNAKWNSEETHTISQKTFEYHYFLDYQDCGRIKNPAKDKDTVMKELATKGIFVGENKWPLFHKDAIKEFLNDMESEWWEEFCEDVHFMGDEGVFMKRALLEVPKTKEYQDFIRRYKKENNID